MLQELDKFKDLQNDTLTSFADESPDNGKLVDNEVFTTSSNSKFNNQLLDQKKQQPQQQRFSSQQRQSNIFTKQRASEYPADESVPEPKPVPRKRP